MSSLSHHGIRGQKWGIRRTPEQLGRINGGKPKVYKLHNYKGKLYFISENEMDGQTLNPRVPKNFLTENGYEDNTTERVCFSHDPGKCLTAMSANVSGKTFNVYSPADKHDVYKPNNIVVPDADITGELWIKEPVKLKKVGTIKCTGDTGEDGLEYSYGGNKAELYDWNYEWLEHCDFLSHHGIKGQRWGVRRFQNKDGTRTSAGKKRYSVEAVDVNSSRKEIKKLVKGFSRKDKEFFFGRRYWDDEYDKGSSEEEVYFGVKKRFVIREGQDIVAFIDAQQTSEEDSELNMVIGTKASARGKGYASALAEKMIDWYDSEGYRSHDGLRWQAANENTGSRKIAEKTGFKQIDDDGLFDDEAVYAYSKNGKQELNKLAKEYANKKSVGKEVKDKINSDFKTTRISKLNPSTEIEPYGWVRSNKGESDWSRMKANLVDAYAERWVKKKHSDDLSRYDKAASSYGKARSDYYKKRKAQHTSIGGTMHIEGNALILGDSSYLEHHGIRGQRWGVRRFQNRDGSLTNAGRKRLGYATKGATQAVKKAFNAGVKTGAKAVKAAKAHHEKAEAKKIEKKKEKASKTRAGVYANKDLFTAKELKDLNAKFEEQDKLAMARLKKGVEIAKAVGQYAQTAKQIGDAYQSITGKNILSHITEIKSANEAKAKEEKEAADKAKAEAEAAAKKAESKAMAKEALQKNIDAFKADQESNARVKDLEKQGNKTAAKTKLAEYIDRYNQDKAAQEQTKQMMKNQKLQEYIDRANQAQREKDSATFKETTDRGKQVIDLLQRHSTDSDLFKEDYQNRVTNAGNSTKPSSVPDDSNLIGLVRKANASNSLSTNSTSRSKDSDDLMAKNREAKAAGDIKDASERASKAIGLLGRKDRITNGNSNDNEPTSVSTPSMNDLAKLIRAANSANSKSGPTIEKSQWQRDLEERTRQLKSDDDNRKLANNLDSIKKAASDASKAANSKSNDPSETTQKLLTNNAKKLDNGDREIGGVFEKALMKKEQRAPNLQKLEAAQKKWKSSSDPSLRKKYMKIVSEELQYLSDDEFDLYMAGKLFKHSAFSDPDFIEHYGVRGMKWGKHLMAGKGGGIYDGTALGAGGGGGPMTEEERKKAEELRKKKLEEAKKKAEEAAKEKEIEKKAKELGISVEAYKRYSIENNHLPGRHHYDKSQKLHGEASSSLAEAQAAERQAHMNRAKAASLMRKVNSSHMFDADGYHISQQRGDDRKEAKRLQKEAKQLDKKSKKALKKSYKKRYKSDKERQKWQNSTSGKYHHMMRHYEIQNGVLFINAGEPYLEHHGVKGMKWGKHLMAGKGVDAEGGGGGGFAEDDEKLKEMAKKAGMSVAEFRTKMAGKLGGAAAKAKKEIGYAYGSEYKKDLERAARLHENNSKSMRAQAKAAWEGYGESRTAAQRDNWKRYAEYDRQAKASGNMFVKRERSKRAYDNSLASKVDSAKRKARLTQDKAKSKISDAVDAAKKTRDDVKDNIRSKTGIGVKKDIERNARLAEGQKRRAHELTKQVYSAKGKEDWARAYAESNKESSKAWDNEHKVKKDTKSYPKSIAGRVDSAKRKARLTKDRLKSALGKSKQRKQLSTEGPKAKKKVRIESASAMGFSTNNPYSIPVDARRWGYNATNKSRVSVGKRGGNMPKTALNPKHTDTSHRRKSVGEVMSNARNEQTPGSTPIPKPTQYTHTNRPRGREKYFKLGQESKGVKKRRRRVKHFDGSDELYTEGTRLVINSKWG